jgi:hypothetical protein
MILAGLGLLIIALIVIQALQAPNRVPSAATQSGTRPTSNSWLARSDEALIGTERWGNGKQKDE